MWLVVLELEVVMICSEKLRRRRVNTKLNQVGIPAIGCCESKEV